MSNTILSRPLRPLSSSFNTTTRRHNKFLKSVPSAPIFTPHQSVAADTIIYNPPSSAPNVYHTPLKFLPANDRRRQLAALQARAAAAQCVAQGASPVTRTGTQLSAPSGLASSYGNILSSSSSSSNPSSSNPAQKLPPPLRQPYEKKYHLTETDVAEIRRLRASDPVTWSRQKLADKFECSPFFVGLVAPAPEHAQRKADEVEELKKRWGPRRRAAREDRKRRKEMWGRGA
ncbi:mitochondrial 54S ribosomal protein mL58 [Phyllosticta citribraziliensis]|uniref:Mitochondrial ribosomal protein subunit L20-domain-containing protein n=1 Tax=Phyllosticta citribraziliensis TaxID=989973 RepID=A0ABR1M471_9PEZI